VAVIAVLAVGTEYSSGLIRPTLAAIPRRTSVLVAKAVLIGALVALASVVGVLVSVLIGRIILRGHGFTLPAVTVVLRPAIGSVLYLTLVALLSVGVAFAVRSSAAGIGVVLGLLYLFPIVALAASDPTWQRRLQQIGPSTAGLGIQATVDLDDLVLSPWAGLGVLAMWALAWLVVGGLVLTRHDA
jgi:ABC-2 type transport system permease protein